MWQILKAYRHTVPKNLVEQLLQLDEFPPLDVFEWAVEQGSKRPENMWEMLLNKRPLPDMRLFRLVRMVPSGLIGRLLAIEPLPPARYFIWALEMGADLEHGELGYLHQADTNEKVDLLLRLGANPNRACTYQKDDKESKNTAFEYHFRNGTITCYTYLMDRGYHPRGIWFLVINVVRVLV